MSTDTNTPPQAVLAPCAACGVAPGNGGHPLLFNKNHCNIHQCTVCGTAFAVTQDFSPEAFYTEDYFNGGHSDGYADYLNSKPVLQHEFERTRVYLSRYVSSGNLLEVGCAYGVFLEQAAPYFTCTGVELAAHASEYCRQNGLDVVTGVVTPALLAQLTAQKGLFDVIVMLDVIEHIPDPEGTLAMLAEHLKPGGYLLITTGDWRSAFARLMGKAWRLMTPPQHLWFFSRRGLSRLAQRKGLQVVAVDHPWKLVPFSLVVYQLLRGLGLSLKLPAALARVQLPVNLFDAMRVVLRKPL